MARKKPEATPAPSLMSAPIPKGQTNRVSAPPPPPKTVEELAAEMELPDHHFNPQLDSEPGELAPVAPKAEETPERDPETGRFLPKTPHNSYFLKKAAELGIPQADIDSLSPEELKDAIGFESSRQTRQLEASAKSEAPPADLVERALEQLDWGKDEDGKPMSPADLHPSIVNVTKQLLNRIVRLERVAETQEGRHSENQLDRAFESFQDERFGKGPMELLDKGSPEFRRRVAVFNEARILAGQDASLSKVLGKLPAARASLFGADKPEVKTPPAKTNGTNGSGNRISGYTPEEWAAAGTSRPTHRTQPAEAKGDSKALRGIAEKLQKIGPISTDTLQGKEEAGLPG